MLGVNFSFFRQISTIQLGIFDGFFLLFRLLIQSNQVFVLGVAFCFFRHISTIQLFNFDVIFLLFRFSMQRNLIFVLGVEFFLQTSFDFLTKHF